MISGHSISTGIRRLTDCQRDPQDRGVTKKQPIVSLSSTEAEYRALTFITKEIVWLRWLLADMRLCLSHLSPMYCDNKSAIQIAHNSVFHERIEHIEIDCHLTRHHFAFCFFFVAACRFLYQVALCFPFSFSY